MPMLDANVLLYKAAQFGLGLGLNVAHLDCAFSQLSASASPQTTYENALVTIRFCQFRFKRRLSR